MRQLLFKLTVGFVFLKSALALITERAFDLVLSNRQVGCRHKTFCCLWWLIRELEACGWIPFPGVRWVEACRQPDPRNCCGSSPKLTLVYAQFERTMHDECQSLT